ncbi:MAG: peptide-methionine (S)-S-oxide reductase [Clostridia bacterium]
MEKAVYFWGGCFWGVEKYFSYVEGVTETEVGYASGHTANPTYEEVCRGHTGHAETVKVVYECQKIGLETVVISILSEYRSYGWSTGRATI